MGQFREDLLARLDLWEFALPGLADRREDIEPNLDYELERYTSETGRRVTLNKEARQRFLDFAMLPSSRWAASFRDLSAAVTRMATIAIGARITTTEVIEEQGRLTKNWHTENWHTENWHTTGSNHEIDDPLGILNSAALAEIDLFDQVQLREVLRVCRTCDNLSQAGRKLFAVSRNAKAKANDADRLRKYLARFGLDWGTVKATA
jgi:transcriptional regulatory protein RtcR